MVRPFTETSEESLRCWHATVRVEIKSPGRSACLPGHRFGAKAGFYLQPQRISGNLSGDHEQCAGYIGGHSAQANRSSFNLKGGLLSANPSNFTYSWQQNRSMLLRLGLHSYRDTARRTTLTHIASAE